MSDDAEPVQSSVQAVRGAVVTIEQGAPPAPGNHSTRLGAQVSATAKRRSSALLCVAVLAASGVATACVPSRPTPLKCTATVSSAHPTPSATEIITVRSTAGATVRTVAQFRSASVAKQTSLNALGFARTAYSLGAAATPGFVVKVVATVTKGNQRTSCATLFTPVGKVTLPPVKQPLPSTPQVTRIAEASGTIGIAWSEADGHGLPITGWKVSRDGLDSQGTGAWSRVLPGSASQFQFTSLIPLNSYNISVAAVTAAGVGPATSRNVADVPPNSVLGNVCQTPGEAVDAFDNAVCDGFEYIPFLNIAVYNAHAQRVTGGVVVTYTANSPSGYYKFHPKGPAQITISGSLSQLRSGSFTFSDPAVVTDPVVKHQFIAGSFSTGRATFTVNGEAPGQGLTADSSEVIGINIS